MKISLTRHIGFSIILLIFAFGSLMASPYPWTITNSGENEENLVVDENGQYLQVFLIQLLEDVDGNGLALPTENGSPQEDDLLLTSINYNTAELNLPDGLFVISTTLFSEVTPFGDQTSYYLRIFNELTVETGTHYSESNEFYSPSSASGTQTEITFNSFAYNYIGNQPPVVDAMDNQDVTAGDILAFGITAEDSDILAFNCIDYSFPGGSESLSISPVSSDTATIEWSVPSTAFGNYLLQFTISDGQFADTLEVTVNVSAFNNVPSAFRLISPSSDRTLFDSWFISWQESISPSEQPIIYNFYWSLDEEFSSIDSLVNIDTTAIQFEFNEGEVVPNSRNSTNNSRLFKEVTSSHNTSSLDEIVTFSPELPEGTQIFWKVKAIHEGTDEIRWSHEVNRTYLENPDSPASAILIEPVDQDTIRTANPEFNWTRATDPDIGDLVSYDFIYTTDGFATQDTIKSLSDTILTVQTESNEINQASVLYNSIWATIRAGINSSSNNKASQTTSSFTSRKLPLSPNITPVRDSVTDDNILTWWVDSVDLYPLRSSSDTSSIFIAIPDNPEEFVLVFPAGNQLFAGPRPIDFQWTPSFDPDPQQSVVYDLLISFDEETDNPSDFEINIPGLDDSHYLYDGILEDDISVKWTVRAISGLDTIWANDDDLYFNVCHFSHRDAPSDFQLISPNEIFIGQEPELFWHTSLESDLFDSISYSILYTVDNWQTFERIDSIVDTSTTLGVFNDGDVIGWKAIAIDSQGHEVAAIPEAGFSFVLDYDDPPLPFSLVSPDSGAVITAPEIEFLWRSTYDPDGLDTIVYLLEVSSTPEFTEPYEHEIANDTTLLVNVLDWNLGDYWWRIKASDATSQSQMSNETWYFNLFATEAEEEISLIPELFEISSLYPNPFNSSINVSLAIPEHTTVSFQIYDILGRKVLEQSKQFQMGYHVVPFDFIDQASGVYFIRIKRNSTIHSVHKVYLQK